MEKPNLKFVLVLFVCSVFSTSAFSQVDFAPITNPVYGFLGRMEARGFLPNESTASLPLTRNRIATMLEKIDETGDKLSPAEKKIWEEFAREFGVLESRNAVVFPSGSDSSQVFFDRLFSSDEKFIYNYRDSSNSISIEPLASVSAAFETGGESSREVSYGRLGARIRGTISGDVGYYLQATNGAIISGDKTLAMQDDQLRKNVKFVYLDSDFDFSESHVNYSSGPFFASIGRVRKLVGSGIDSRIYVSDHAPPADAISVGVDFDNFRYRFTHASLLSSSVGSQDAGAFSELPPKYLATHRFALRPKWGEIALWEGLVYFDRNIDLAYLNPLSFFKSLEHALHDRDNSMMGLDFRARPIGGVQFVGSLILDDVIFKELGSGYWGNKFAWNLGAVYSSSLNSDFGIEYVRIEPYTFSHFNPQNAYVNDSLTIGSEMQPNSDRFTFLYRFWTGGRYPLILKASRTRHGRNIYDEAGELVENVGGDVWQTRRPDDPKEVDFLAGNLIEEFRFDAEYRWEIVRGYSFGGGYAVILRDDETLHRFVLNFRYEDF